MAGDGTDPQEEALIEQGIRVVGYEARGGEYRFRIGNGVAKIRSAYFVEGDRVIFDIGGNKYRLIVHVAYKFHAVYIRFIGTHAEYDKIDATKV